MIHTFLIYATQVAKKPLSEEIDLEVIGVLLDWLFDRTQLQHFEIISVMNPARGMELLKSTPLDAGEKIWIEDNPVAQNGTICGAWNRHKSGVTFPFGKLGEDDEPYQTPSPAPGWYAVTIMYNPHNPAGQIPRYTRVEASPPPIITQTVISGRQGRRKKPWRN